MPAVLGGAGHPQAGRRALHARPSPRSSRRCSAASGAGTVILQGLLQGVGAELAFAAVPRTASFRLPVALLAGALTGLGAALFDFFV